MLWHLLLEILFLMIGNFLIKALLKPGEYLQWAMWFQDVARDRVNSNARAGAPQNQITFEMLTGTGQFDAVEAQNTMPSFVARAVERGCP